MSRASDMVAALLRRLGGAPDPALRREAVALLDRHGGDVTAATRWCNDQMRRGGRDRADRALQLRRALGEVWAERVGARTARARAPR